MTLPSRHKIRNPSPGGLRPSTQLFGHKILILYEWAGKKHSVSLILKGQSGFRTRDPGLSKQAALNTAPGPLPSVGISLEKTKQNRKAVDELASLLTNLLWPWLWHIITLGVCAPLSSVRWGYRRYRSFINWSIKNDTLCYLILQIRMIFRHLTFYPQNYSIWIFTHLKLCFADAIHSENYSDLTKWRSTLFKSC